MADPTNAIRPDLWYYPSDYALAPAVALQYDNGRSALGRPVPLTDLFPVFASSPAINKTTPVPIVDLCLVRYEPRISQGPRHLDSTTSSLSLCAVDHCQKELAQVSRSEATYEALVFAINGTRGSVAAPVHEHFNSYNALDECTIRNCPTEYFVSRSSLCISLRHPYFVRRNIFLPALPPQYLNATGKDFAFRRPNVQLFSDYLARVPPSQSPQASGDVAYDDLGVSLPAFPLGFPCDYTQVDQSTGAALPGKAGMAAINSVMSSTGTWLASSGGGGTQWDLSFNGTEGTIATHSWMAKSTLFRGTDGLGQEYPSTTLRHFASVPANLYSLGHCPRSTGTFSASKLSGEPCSSSIECVFSLCVGGKCAEAASGKQLDLDTALNPLWEKALQGALRKKQQEANWWMAVVGAIAAGLVVLRVLWIAVKRNRQALAKKQQSS